MTNKEKQLLLKVLCEMLPHGVIVNTPNGDGHLTSITETLFGNEYGVNINPLERGIFNDRDCDIRPYLRPMSSMTSEEKNYIKNRWCYEWEEDCSDLFNNHQIDFCDASNFVDWLNAHHFDYRGLIDKGLAIEAPKDMYND